MTLGRCWRVVNFAAGCSCIPSRLVFSHLILSCRQTNFQHYGDKSFVDKSLMAVRYSAPSRVCDIIFEEDTSHRGLHIRPTTTASITAPNI